MPTQHTTVVIMLFVTIPGDPITARVKMDFIEMEETVLVNICNKLCFNESRVSSLKYYSKAVNLTRHTFGKFLKVALYDLYARQ